jgi:hypothetical protein
VVQHSTVVSINVIYVPKVTIGVTYMVFRGKTTRQATDRGVEVTSSLPFSSAAAILEVSELRLAVWWYDWAELMHNVFLVLTQCVLFQSNNAIIAIYYRFSRVVDLALTPCCRNKLGERCHT